MEQVSCAVHARIEWNNLRKFTSIGADVSDIPPIASRRSRHTGGTEFVRVLFRIILSRLPSWF